MKSYNLSKLYEMLKDAQQRFEQNPKDFTAKHMIESIKDEIKIKRNELHK